MQQRESDDQRTVTTTVARLKAFEAATRAREDARLKAARASDALDVAKAELERARRAESDAQSDGGSVAEPDAPGVGPVPEAALCPARVDGASPDGPS